ncbi:hypothetical protein [Pelagibaculum spongiae]|uniref:Flagellar protein FliT n=1 Tax=Pelagibaculum spongiae TaxID=2080658 RepID=A0A2V1H358_9GAMM|nr:hypothetical protein [Pelagibaculum spongiae]PVZ72410.1 hypothetical protein DC094_05240 [Pelagibaculum spongiae]
MNNLQQMANELIAMAQANQWDEIQPKLDLFQQQLTEQDGQLDSEQISHLLAITERLTSLGLKNKAEIAKKLARLKRGKKATSAYKST